MTWMGLHNPEWHHLERSGHVSCDSCGETRCGQADPCRCCLFAEWGQAQSLRAEVERLTALLKAADDVVASQGRRIAAALDLMGDRANSSPGYPLLERVLRGES